MPPINQQSSRAGLITALVVSTILFIVSTVFAFQFFGQWKQVDANYTNYKKTYNNILSDAAIQSTPVQALVASKGEGKLGVSANDTVVDVLLKQVTALTGTIGAPVDQQASAVVEGADGIVKDSQKKLDAAGVKVSLPATGLENGVSSLTDAVIAREKTIATLNSQLKDASAKADAATKDVAAVNAKRDEDVKTATQAGTDQVTQVTANLDAIKGSNAQIMQTQTEQAKKDADALTQAAADLAAEKAKVSKSDIDIAKLQTRLGSRRVKVTDAVVRQSDGRIVRVPNTSVCYINLGQGDQVTAGLTFEVYDKLEGVPAIPDNVTGDEQLPVGKASIEITHVGVTSSECRIVKIQPGAVISEGDPIANLVYDPHTKYNFYVFGNFDLAENGRPNPSDAAFVKQLVTQWGGKLTDVVNVNTDFVVLGAEPVLPTFSKDDLTPENQDKMTKAQEALDKYQEVRQQAKDLHIPVLNQNRFLYYVGYYDQAKR